MKKFIFEKEQKIAHHIEFMQIPYYVKFTYLSSYPLPFSTSVLLGYSSPEGTNPTLRVCENTAAAEAECSSIQSQSGR